MCVCVWILRPLEGKSIFDLVYDYVNRGVRVRITFAGEGVMASLLLRDMFVILMLKCYVAGLWQMCI